MKQTLFIRQLASYFYTHLPHVRNCSSNTITSYADSFALLFQFMQEKKGVAHTKVDYKKFTPVFMEEFILWLSHERGYSAASVKQRFSAITSFMKYASRRDMAALNAYTVVAGTEKPKVVKSAFPYFTLEEMRVLLRLPKPDKKIGKRDLVLLSVFYDSAARAQELCDLKVGDVKFGSPTKLRLIGKGRKSREIAVTSDVADLLRYHIKENGLEKQSPLFASQSGDKMTTACIRNIVDKYVALAKDSYPDMFFEPKYSPHSFRHSKAVHMVESGSQLIYIRDFLGHATVQSTEIYAKIGQHALAKMLTERTNHIAPLSEKSVSEDFGAYPKFLDTARRK